MMAWLAALLIVGFLWNRLEDERALRKARRLLRRLDAESSGIVQHSPESPSPHRLLGDIARPLASLPHGRGSTERAFRSLRSG